MSQKSLTQWFGNDQINQTKFKNAFFYDVNQKKASWINQEHLPGNLAIKKNIKWSQYKYDVVVCCNYDTTKTKEQIDVSQRNIYNLIDKDKISKKIPLYKSHLQKCVRRGLVEKAIKTAKSFLELNFLEFIRRLSIIMFEDCALHESFTKLSWMVAAYPEWLPTIDDINYLLGVVKHLASMNIRNLVKKSDFNMKQNIRIVNKLEEPYLSLIYSIDFRKSFGGLTGDMLMLAYFSKYWLENFKNLSKWEKEIIHQPIDIIDYYTINGIDFDEIDKSAIDFHIFPKMTSLIFDYFRNDNKDKLKIPFNPNNIKLAIWYLRSSTNHKKLIDIELNNNVSESKENTDGKDEEYESKCIKYKKLYTLIENYVDQLSHRYLISLKN